MRYAGVLLLFLMLFGSYACADGLSVRDCEASGFSENTIYVDAPSAGTVVLRLTDRLNTYRVIETSVHKGSNEILWDGLGENKEPLPTGAYTLRVSLTAEEDGSWAATANVQIKRARQALRYALPSDRVFYLGQGADWFVEFCLVREGTVYIEIHDEQGVLIQTKRHEINKDSPARWRWGGMLNHSRAAVGRYTMTCYAPESPAYQFSFPVEVVDSDAPDLPVEPTGAILPTRDMNDAAIWAIMQKPSVVVDIKNTNHQKVYTSPDTESRSLGTLHGQSQALEVLEVDHEWAHIRAWNHEEGAPMDGYVPLRVLKTVQPDPTYGLLIDKESQQIAIFQDGQRIAEMPVSTGLAAKNKLIRETAAGCFLTVEHVESFSDGGYRYDYPIRYDGGNLLHQLGYKKVNGRPDYTDQLPQLGQKASHGCVRICSVPEADSGINMYWLWTHLPYHTRVIILDDPVQRDAQISAARAGQSVAPQADIVSDAETDLSISVSHWQPATPTDLSEGETQLVLTLGGDTVLGVREGWWRREDSLAAYLDRHGMSWPFSALQSVFATDDMTFVNLECTLKSDKNNERTDKKFRFRGRPSWAAALTEGSVEQVSIANNHYIDYNSQGKKATRTALEAAGIPYSGYGYQYIWEQDGHRIGFAGIRETIYKQDTRRIQREISSLREAGCDVVIYSCHWGVEYSPMHNDLQLEMALAAAQAGADLVVGTHPHVVQGIDCLNGTPVLWSLGNLMFGGTIEMNTFDGVLARVWLRFDDQGYLGCELELIPILTSSRAAENINDYRPVIAEGEDRERIIDLIRMDSAFEPDGRLWFPARSR